MSPLETPIELQGSLLIKEHHDNESNILSSYFLRQSNGYVLLFFKQKNGKRKQKSKNKTTKKLKY